ncbi:MAG: YlmC/YmxH family sporulation protein [Syntrophomonadaceae bacterium]|nr:YlmC/YmxH family sporulation protein [Bacillota bacterium]NLM88034.1 YlmC/YmxH family sporulation protein [Syntrophomonadaceae bacterium]HAA08474.1 YlmC/YmxH family sporulation protein [Syntrophomonas sp.]HQA49202.1 YlmC/YmxH family sporulation protein [Syntrophomonadaceae bacterium]HQD89393.1 YlmC/YmxH family sporulation protein [Syntrophomonadaceae bacterium]
MRLNELVGKEMVNIFDGMRMGTVGESDMLVNQETGDIVSIILPNRGNAFTFWADRQKLVIPWDAVKKIGREVIVVDLDNTHMRMKNHTI